METEAEVLDLVAIRSVEEEVLLSLSLELLEHELERLRIPRVRIRLMTGVGAGLTGSGPEAETTMLLGESVLLGRLLVDTLLGTPLT